MASCIACGHLGDWRKTDVKQACVSVSPVVLENWPVGHSVCSEGKGNFIPLLYVQAYGCVLSLVNMFLNFLVSKILFKKSDVLSMQLL